MKPRDEDRILLALSNAEREERGGWLVYEAERRRFLLEDPLGATHAIFPERKVLSLQRYGFLRPGSRGWVLAPEGRKRLRAVPERKTCADSRRRFPRGLGLSEIVFSDPTGNDSV